MARLNHDVVISGADNGIVVRVGCKTLVFHKSEYGTFLQDLGLLINGEEEKLRRQYYPEDFDKSYLLNDTCSAQEVTRAPEANMLGRRIG